MGIMRLQETDSFDAYMRSIKRIPRLSKEEQHLLAIRYYENNDMVACKQLIECNLRFVAYISRRFDGYNISMMDIVQEGNYGLMQSLKNYDPYSGMKLMTFSVYYIKYYILEYVKKNFGIFKIASKSQNKVFFNIKKMTKEEDISNSISEKTIERISSALNVSKKSVIDTHKKMYCRTIEASGDDFVIETEDIYFGIEREEEENIKQEKYQKIISAIENLNEREKTILERRFLKEIPDKLQEIAKEQGCSLQRISEIEKRAIKKIQKVVLF